MKSMSALQLIRSKQGPLWGPPIISSSYFSKTKAPVPINRVQLLEKKKDVVLRAAVSMLLPRAEMVYWHRSRFPAKPGSESCRSLSISQLSVIIPQPVRNCNGKFRKTH